LTYAGPTLSVIGRAPATCTPQFLHPNQGGRCLPLSPVRLFFSSAVCPLLFAVC